MLRCCESGQKLECESDHAEDVNLSIGRTAVVDFVIPRPHKQASINPVERRSLGREQDRLVRCHICPKVDVLVATGDALKEENHAGDYYGKLHEDRPQSSLQRNEIISITKQALWGC